MIKPTQVSRRFTASSPKALENQRHNLQRIIRVSPGPILTALLTAALLMAALPTAAQTRAADIEPPETIREIFVPNADLKVLLSSGPHRVLLSRNEYDALVKKAKTTPETHVPHPTVTVSADYDITVADARALLHGTIAIDVLEEGMHAVPLDFGGVGLLAARLDGQPAAIGYAPDGRMNLLVTGKGTHRLTVELVAPLEMNSAQQSLGFRVVNAAVGRWRLTVPGDVEIKGGAHVVSRTMDAAAGVTRFELLPRCGNTTILMSLNSHFQRLERAVAARCIVFDELTEAYEKLHATVTCWVLHRATDRLRFIVPQGFEITEINSPLLARWDIETEASRKIVNVRLREQTTDTVVLSVTAIRAPAPLKPWRMPRLELLDVVGQVTVLGLLVQDDVQAESLSAKDLIPVDTQVLAAALPASLLRPEPGAVPLRYLAAYYAPQTAYDLTADFSRTARSLAVTTNLLLSIQNKGCEVRGGFALQPAVEKQFSFDFSVPAGWSVIEVTGPDNRPLAVERFAGEKGGPGRVHVKLPQGIAPGQYYLANFRAELTPPNWLSDWKSQTVEFPMFRVAGTQRDEGAVAVTADEDMAVRPEKVEGLVPVTAAEMARFGMAGGAANLAYRYEGSAGKATIAVDRTQSRTTARTFAFFQVIPDLLRAHYVMLYTIEDAKTRRLSLLLPESTPEALKIHGLEGATVKEFFSEPVAGHMRRWNVLLDEARKGEVRLAVDFEMRPQAAVELPPPDKQKPAVSRPDATGKTTELKDFELPLIKADAVVYQSGLVAVEGDLELAVDVKTTARRADVGQFAISKYTPDSLDPAQLRSRLPLRLLGTYEFVGETPKVAVDAVRNPSYAIAPAIVERARITTLLSADGTSQTKAAFLLRTKAPYLEFELPENATLWSVVLDGTPLKPQRNGKARLIGLPPSAADAARNLQLVYEAPVESVPQGGRLTLKPPRLLYRGSRAAKESTEVPVVNIEWNVATPEGYEVVGTDGTLEAKTIGRPAPAPLVVAGVLYELGGGVGWSPMRLMGSSEAKSATRKIGEAKPAGSVMSQDNAISSSWGVDVDDTRSWGVVDETKSMNAPQMPAGGSQSSQIGKTFAKIDKSLAARDEAPAAFKADTPSVFVGPSLNESSPKSEPAAGKGDILLFGEKGKPAESKSDAGSVAPPAVTFNNAASSYTIAKPTYQRGDLLGFRSLKIDVETTGMDGQNVTFNSLGANPEIGLTLARRDRLDGLAWAFGLAVFVLAMALTGQPARRKTVLVIGLLLLTAFIPQAWDAVSVMKICNAMFYAGCLLVPYYLVAGLCSWTLLRLDGVARRIRRPPPVAAALLAGLTMLLAATAQSQPPGSVIDRTDALLEAIQSAQRPVTVPTDALIVPYDAKSKTGIEDADHVLVSYDRYVELWNRAYPDKKIEAHPAPLSYALSDATYSATLEGEETLNITGRMQVNVLIEGYVSVPLGLRGGVLARANLDGKPAQLKVVGANEQSAQPQTKVTMDGTLLLLQVSGKGAHTLELEVRLKLAHVGGWRETSGSLPMAPTATVTIRVPHPQTEVRLGQAIDRRIHETKAADETLDTALGPGGALHLAWRPKVAEAQVDRGLTVQTVGLLDILENGLRMALHINLEFRRGQRDAFTLSLPADYLVEKLAGMNVRGWEVRRAATEQTVEVSLLKTAKDSEQFNLFLSRNGKIGQAPLDTFAVPMVTIRDAALSSGQLTIRRSGLLDVRTVDRTGVTRVDLGPLPDLSGGPATDESVLAIRPYEAYRFPTTPFTLKLSASPAVAEVRSEAQTRVALDPSQPRMESRITFHVGQRRVYRFEIVLPNDLREPEVILPAAGIWSVEKRGARSVLEVYLQQGGLGDLALILRGRLAPLDARQTMPLPQLDVLGVGRQEGEIALQADPAFTVEDQDLKNCQETQLEQVSAWLDPRLRSSTRLALRYDSRQGGGVYSGKLKLASRAPRVACDTVTNVHLTDRSIEETIVLNYDIRIAGVRELNFLLPASMADARVSAPMLRRKTISPVDPKSPDSLLAVKLELQGDAMNDLRVLIENDRLLTPGSHTAPLPRIAAAGHQADFVRHQYVVLEKPSNRDELVVEPLAGFLVLSRQQQQWQALGEMLGVKQLYQAYLMEPGAAAPRLSFHLQKHDEVETAGARIDLAETTILVDANGAYRAKLALNLDNSSEQFLDVELPEGATLWTVSVAGEPVKPAAVPGATDMRHVMLPVRKTAKGDVSYLVVLKYGGKMPPLSVASAVDFPLVRTVQSYPRKGSIAIEQTQVQVYVPKSRYWYDFSRTMHSTDDEAELKAGRIAAFTRQGQRLIEAAQDADPFARVRGKENLKNWVAEAETTVQREDGRGRASGNKTLAMQIASCRTTATQAKSVLQETGDGKQSGDAANVDNRDRLNNLYREQNVGNAQGELVLAGKNSYSGGTTVSGGTLSIQANDDFNPNWIARNSLGNTGEALQQARGMGTGPQEADKKANRYVNDSVQSSALSGQGGLTKSGAGMLQPDGGRININGGALEVGAGGTIGSLNGAPGFNFNNGGDLGNANPNFANGRIILNGQQGGQGAGNTSNIFTDKLNSSQQQLGGFFYQPQANPANRSVPAAEPQPSYGGRGGKRDDQEREITEYRQKLETANQNVGISGLASPSRTAGVAPGMGLAGTLHDAMGDAKGDEASKSAAFGPGVSAAGSAGTAALEMSYDPSKVTAAVAPAGLASLDFELPVDASLYELHRFTTPRGDAQLSARSISNTALGKAEFLLGLAVAGVLTWFAFGLIRRGLLRWFCRPLGALLLLTAGILLLCGGMLPVVGAIAVVLGITFLIAAVVRAALA
jgi:autotransporter-associated beta strand protein